MNQSLLSHSSVSGHLGGVLVCSSCYNQKKPQTGQLINNRKLLLTVVEARKFKIQAPARQCSDKGLPIGCRLPTSGHVLTGWEGIWRDIQILAGCFLFFRFYTSCCSRYLVHLSRALVQMAPEIESKNSIGRAHV